MRLPHFIAGLSAVSIAVISLFPGRATLCAGFFSMYQNPDFSAEGMSAVEQFDPDNDTFYIPSLKDKDFFKSINDFSIVRRADVRRYLYLYLTADRRYIADSIARARAVIPTIKPVLAKYPDIPEEILLLPLLESGFDPYAVSPSSATGLWQFIGSTSASLGLKTDSFVDERRDIIKSTDAALRHLKFLKGQFGSWEAALAAYNGGSGYVARTMGTVTRRRFWSTVDRRGFRPETNEYVSRYAALTLIYKNTRLFGIEKAIPASAAEKTESVVFETPVRLDILAAQAGIPENEIRKHNPELNGCMTPPYAGRYSLKIASSLKDVVTRYANDPSWQM